MVKTTDKYRYTRRRARFVSAPTAMLLAMVVSGCAMTGARPAPDMSTLNQMQELLEKAERSHDVAILAPPAEAMRDLMPGLSVSEDVLAPVEERFNIVAREEPAREFFNNLVAGTDIGVVVSPQITGNISIAMPDVTIDDVMNAVSEMYGYRITRTDNVYRVQPTGVETRIFSIDYLNVQRAGSSNVQVTGGSSGSTGGTSSFGGGLTGGTLGGSLGGFGGVSSGIGGISSGIGGIGGVTGGRGGGQVSTQTRTDFWSDIRETVQYLAGGGANVVVQPQVGLVMVTAMPAALDRVQAYLDQAQEILSREVTIQVQFLEVILNKGYQSAIDFDTFGTSVTAEFSSGAETDIPGISNPISFTTNFTDFSSVFQILESRGTTHVLSSPSLKVLNNQKAVFQDGDEEFFQTSVGSNIITAGQTTTQASAASLRPFFSGISMDITPQISADGAITLHVRPTITTVTEQSKRIEEQQVPLARTAVRELDSVIRAEDGKIVVLGGLAYERTVDDAAGIPVAVDIPFIGGAFDQRRRTTVKSEFIILLRPIIANPQSEQNMLRERNERLRQINRELDPFAAQ